jgi:hypothetical protein
MIEIVNIKHMKTVFAALILLTSVLAFGCSRTSSPVVEDKPDETSKIFIQDRTGKKWEITHAVNEYGLDSANFNFGLGPNAIPPILDPQFLKPGDTGYPTSSENFRVIGTTIEGESRAYRISALSGHEVVDDQLGAIYFAVAY